MERTPPSINAAEPRSSAPKSCEFCRDRSGLLVPVDRPDEPDPSLWLGLHFLNNWQEVILAAGISDDHQHDHAVLTMPVAAEAIEALLGKLDGHLLLVSDFDERRFIRQEQHRTITAVMSACRRVGAGFCKIIERPRVCLERPPVFSGICSGIVLIPIKPSLTVIVTSVMPSKGGMCQLPPEIFALLPLPRYQARI